MIAVLTAAVVGLVVSILGAPAAVRALVRRGYGKPIRDKFSASHQTKRGTPTMGGLVIVLAVLIGYRNILLYKIVDDLLRLRRGVLWYSRTSSARTHSMLRMISVASCRFGSIPSAR